MDNSYSVYRHIFPTGEIYIGITSGDVEDRWKNGFGYESQRKFFKRIVAVGWDNIKHEILASGLDEKQAREMERVLIAKETNNALNTQMRVGWSNPVKNIPIADGDNATRKRRFSEYADYWLDKAKYRNTVPFTWEIYPDHIDITYYTHEKNTLCLDIFRVNLPPDITYDQLYHYLTWKCDFSKAEHVRCEKLADADNRFIHTGEAEVAS